MRPNETRESSGNHRSMVAGKWMLGIVTTVMLASLGAISHYGSAADAQLGRQIETSSEGLKTLGDRVVQVAELLAVTSESLAEARRALDGQEVRLRTVEIWRAQADANRYTIQEAQRDAQVRADRLDALRQQLGEQLEKIDARLRDLSDRIKTCETSRG